MSQASLVGSQLAGRFRLLEHLGDGSVGEVYRAEHPILGRQYAIKLLKPAFQSNPTILERFRREAQVASRLEHPNIVYISDFGCAEDGRLYLAMEYIQGVCLNELVDQTLPNLVPLPRALAILRQVASAVQVAHDAGILHRDLKPENIMLTADVSGEDVVKILDFGLAKIMVDTDLLKITKRNEIFGTPMFMSPEQARGEELDARTDIYSLGVVAFELFTGRPPFECRTMEELIVANQMVTPPSPAALRPATAVALPEALDQLVLQCLEKDRDKRPPNVAMVARVFDQCLGHVRPNTAPYAPYTERSDVAHPVVSAAQTRDTVPDPSSTRQTAQDADRPPRRVRRPTAPRQAVVAPEIRMAAENPWQWRKVRKQIRSMAQLLQKQGLSTPEIDRQLQILDTAQTTVSGLESELATPAAHLEEIENATRERTAQLRHAAIDLTLERDLLADLGDVHQVRIDDLNFQIRTLEERLAEEHRTARELGADLEHQVGELEAKRQQAERAQTDLELSLLRHLRAARTHSPPPAVTKAFDTLEAMIQEG